MNNTKSLIIYFSRADENYFDGKIKNIDKGNTEIIAEYIKYITNADIFKVEPLVKYSKKYTKCIEEAKERIQTHDAPIKENISDIASYDVIYIGSPVYWGKMPEELPTTLKNLNFENKTIKPFITHEGSGAAQIPDQIKKICRGANVLDSLVIVGSEAKNSKAIVEDWI